uniref:Uncharacterized protein n=1 Tax=Strongyloides venezuelensis TaxID=75913 RepID=A0A0K0FPL5_STRVS
MWQNSIQDTWASMSRRSHSLRFIKVLIPLIVEEGNIRNQLFFILFIKVEADATRMVLNATIGVSPSPGKVASMKKANMVVVVDFQSLCA